MEDGREEEDEEEEAVTDIKSNNAHLPGGEKINCLDSRAFLIKC